MTTRVFDFINGNDSSDGRTVGTAWKTMAKFRSSVVAGDTALFVGDGDWRGDTFGTNGQLEIAGAGITIGRIGSGSDPLFGGAEGATVAVSAVTLSGGGGTIDTATAHGLTTGQTILAENIGGTATEANANWQVTVSTATRFTITGTTTTGSAGAGGTIKLVANEKAVIYNSGNANLTVANVQLRGALRGIQLAGSSVTGNLFSYVDAQYMGRYGFSLSGSSSGVSIQHCSGGRVREDFINISGSSNTAFDVGFTTASYIGYDFSGTKFVPDLGTGPGDFVTCHAGSGASNYGDIHDCTASWGAQGGSNHANTAGTIRGWNNFFFEFSGSGFAQSGGGSVVYWNNLYIAPSSAALDNTAQRGMFKFNPSSGIGGTFECYQNSGYTARGSIASFATAAAMVIVSGGLTTSLADQFVFKNNRFMSNGTAPFMQIANQNSVAITNLVLSGGTATVTATSHGLTTGRRVRIIGVTGGAAAINNQTLTCTVVDANTYTVPFAGTGTSTAGFSQRMPMVASDYNAYSGASSATLWSYGATSASYTGAGWQAQGYDAHSVFGASCRVFPPTAADDFRLNGGCGGLSAGADLSGLGYAGVLVDRDGTPRGSTPDCGAFQVQASATYWAGARRTRWRR